MTYLGLNLIFLAIAFGFGAIVLRKDGWLNALKSLTILGTLTAIFDNFIIGFGIVDYDVHKISGIKLGLVPIEDFAYTLAVVVLIPAAWKLLGRGRK